MLVNVARERPISADNALPLFDVAALTRGDDLAKTELGSQLHALRIANLSKRVLSK